MDSLVIRCSSCGNDVEISLMGEHVCDGAAKGGGPTPPPEPTDVFSPRYNPFERDPLGPGTTLSGGKTGASNRPYVPTGQLTPISGASDSSSNLSPRTIPRRHVLADDPEDFELSSFMREPNGNFARRLNSISPAPLDLESRNRRAPNDFAASHARNALSRLAAKAIEPSKLLPTIPTTRDLSPPPRRDDDFNKAHRGLDRPRRLDPPEFYRDAPAPVFKDVFAGHLAGPSVAMGARTGQRSRDPTAALADEFDIGNPFDAPAGGGLPPVVSRPANGLSSEREESTGFDKLISSLRADVDRPLANGRRLPAITAGPFSSDAARSAPSRSDLPRRYDSTAKDSAAFPRSTPRNAAREAPRARPRLDSRGNCRACSHPITNGPSVASADGRLSGRYHKDCFVCFECRDPFRSSEFYVYNDRPYCASDYHRLNGSICSACGDGIEGKYISVDQGGKFHSGCFRCRDCNIALNDNYFEVAGEAYCERHAWRRIQRVAKGYPASTSASDNTSDVTSSADSRGTGNRRPPYRNGTQRATNISFGPDPLRFAYSSSSGSRPSRSGLPPRLPLAVVPSLPSGRSLGNHLSKPLPVPAKGRSADLEPSPLRKVLTAGLLGFGRKL